MSFILVLLQFILAAALVVSFRPSKWSVVGIALAGGGISLLVWAVLVMQMRHLSIMPEVREQAQLVTAGPYRFIRHPMYAANLLLTAGFGVMPFHWTKLLGWCVLVFVLAVKSRREEDILIRRFPEYRTYRERTARFLPFLF